MLPPSVETKKREKTRTCCASFRPPLRRSRRLNPNPDADKIRHGKPEKRFHPKKEEKQVSSSDFYDDIRNWHKITAEECAFYEEHILKSDVSKINSLRLLHTHIYIYIYIHAFHSFVVCCLRALMLPPCVGLSLLV
jgi:hypothetical protein